MNAKEPLCLLKDINLRLPGAERPILRDINYTIHSGDRVILLGSNGSGKSSLLKLLNRTYTPTTGKIYLRKKNLQKFQPQQLSQAIVTFTQDLRDSLFFNLTVLENCLLWETRFKKKQFQHTKMSRNKIFPRIPNGFSPAVTTKINTIRIHIIGWRKTKFGFGFMFIASA